MEPYGVYLLMKFIIQTLSFGLEFIVAIAIFADAKLRKSPIWCLTLLVLLTDCFEIMMVFYAHDFLYGLNNAANGFLPRGVVLFVATVRWNVHILTLLSMAILFTILLKWRLFYITWITRSRCLIALLILIVASALALPHLNSENFGFKYHVESLSWTIDMNRPISITYTYIFWTLLGVLTFIISSSGLNIFICIKRIRKRNQVGPYSLQSAASKKLMSELYQIFVFCGIGASYFIPIYLFNRPPKNYASDPLFYGSLEVLNNAIDGTKWVIFSVYSYVRMVIREGEGRFEG